MANTNSKRNSGNKNTAKRKSNSSSRSKSTVSNNQHNAVLSEERKVYISDHLHAFSKTGFCRILIIIAIIAALIGLDLLIAWNSFDRFFLIVGIEVICIAVIYILRQIVGKSKSDK